MGNKFAKQVASEIRQQEARNTKIQQAENFTANTGVLLLVIGALVAFIFSPGILIAEVINMIGFFLFEDPKLSWIAPIIILSVCAGVFFFIKSKVRSTATTFYYYAINNLCIGGILLAFSGTNIHGLGAFYGLNLLFGFLELL